MPVAEEMYTLNDFAWEGGLKLSMFNKGFEIFLPMIMSDELQNTNDLITNKYLQRVRFSIRLNKLNPINIIENQLL